jgi:hypothetical protein
LDNGLDSLASILIVTSLEDDLFLKKSTDFIPSTMGKSAMAVIQMQIYATAR